MTGYGEMLVFSADSNTWRDGVVDLLLQDINIPNLIGQTSHGVGMLYNVDLDPHHVATLTL